MARPYAALQLTPCFELLLLQVVPTSDPPAKPPHPVAASQAFCIGDSLLGGGFLDLSWTPPGEPPLR